MIGIVKFTNRNTSMKRNLKRKVKITYSDQSHNPFKECKIKRWETQTPGHTIGGIRCLRRVSIPCWPGTLSRSNKINWITWKWWNTQTPFSSFLGFHSTPCLMTPALLENCVIVEKSTFFRESHLQDFFVNYHVVWLCLFCMW